MIDRIIIITTAISRIDMHSTCFPIYKKFIGNDYDVKWFINIDKPSYCTDNVNDVEANLKNILSGYDLFIHKSASPNFFYAVKTLLNASKPYLTDTSCVLWLEDDWMLNKECDVKYFIDNLVKPMSIISLVYNLLGSLPPFMMGHSIASLFYDKFIVLDKPKQDPEKVSRRIMRILANTFGIVYYSYFDNLDALVSLKRLKRQHLVKYGLLYKESYLVIENCKILCPKTNFTSVAGILPVESIEQYKNQPDDKIIFVRFGVVSAHKNYEGSYFRDVGRPWKYNILHKSVQK